MSAKVIAHESSANQLLTVTLAAVSSLEKGGEYDEISDRDRDDTSRGHPSTSCLDAVKKSDQPELVIVGPEIPSSSSLSQYFSTDGHSAASSRSVISESSSSHSVRMAANKLRERESPFAARAKCVVDDMDNVSTPAALINQAKCVDENNRQDVEARQNPRCSLQQGFSTEQTLPASAQVQPLTENNSELIVSSWALDSGEKKLLEEFSKRNQRRKTELKPAVQACFHKRLSNPNSQIQNEKPSTQTGDSSSVATAAAAAAASAAVASSSQYLQTVHALESKVTGLVSHLKSMKDTYQTEMTVQQRNLQKQIDRHTQLRLEQLERLGEQQSRLETQIASVLLARGGQRQTTGDEGGAKKSVSLISRGIQSSPLEIDENTPPRLQGVSHQNRRKLLGRNGDNAAAPLLDTLYAPAPVAPIVIDRQLTDGNVGMSRADERPDTGKPSLDESNKTGEIFSKKSTDDEESERNVRVAHWQPSRDRIRKMESVLETMQNELVELRQGTDQWRQRLEDRKVTANRPTWLPISPNDQLNAVEHIVEQCEISRRNLEYNIASVIRQQNQRFWREGTVDDDDDDRILINSVEQVKRAVDKNIAAVSKDIKDELAAYAVVPTSNTNVAVTRRQGASKGFSKRRSKSQSGKVLRETQKGSIRKLLGKKSSEQEAIAERFVGNKTKFTVPQVLGGDERYRLQRSKTVSFARRNRIPSNVERNWDNERRSIRHSQLVEHAVGQARDYKVVALALAPPRRTALAGWDKAEKDDMSESNEPSLPLKKSVFIQTRDEATEGNGHIDKTAFARSKRRPELSKQVLSPIVIDSTSLHSDSVSYPSRSSVKSAECGEQEKTRDQVVSAEEDQFDHYLTVREVFTDSPDVQMDEEQKSSELENNEEDIDLEKKCHDICNDFPLPQEISMHGEIHQRSSRQNTGPTFPPVPQTTIPSHSNVDDMDGTGDITVEQRICEWVEQELLAQLFSHMDPPGPDHHLAMQNFSPGSSVSRESTSSSDHTHVSLINGRIVQLFVDAGLDVDVRFIEEIAGGVICDMLLACLGQCSLVVPAVALSEHAVSSIYPETNGTPVASESGDELPTPIPTRSQSPVCAQIAVDATTHDGIAQVTPPSTPLEIEETSVEERLTEVADALKTSKNIDLQQLPFVFNVAEGEDVGTPADSVISRLSNSGGDEVSDNKVPTPLESVSSQAQSVASQDELELSRSVDFVVAETQTSQQYLPQQETTEHHSRHSLSGTSTSTSSPTSIHSKSSDPIVVTSDATTTLSTDPEISEGEYLLAHTEARSDPVMASCEVPEVSEGEFAASPGDIRYMRGKTRSEITSQSLRYHQDVEGGVHTLMKAFLDTSPVENMLSESSSSSEPRRPKKSRRRVSREALSLRGLVLRVEEPIQQQNVRNYLRLDGRSGHGDDDGGSEQEQDISVGQVVSSAASRQQPGKVATGQTECDRPEDLSYGEVVQRDVVRDVIALSIADRASAELASAHSPGEIKRAAPTNERGTGTSTVAAFSTTQMDFPLDDCPSASGSPDSLALAQAAFHEVQSTLPASPHSDNEVGCAGQVAPQRQTELDGALSAVTSESTLKQDGRSLRSLFSKPKRSQRQGRLQLRETAHLPSVLQQAPRRLQLVQPRDVQKLQPSRTAERSGRPIQSSDLSHQVDVNVPSGPGHPADDLEDDTYGDLSSISISGGDF
ncbi:protein TALPID3-like isoform X3 [Corticium candelabrum]|uniref:protein TALPID3-like isoform X3 n=1 Tax=Corticium candelabrum TaxID=121492 RepID=UPI002E263F10|nr:protein TALPID3-like isoform X3 [Corticium candelabrum]